MTSCGAGLTGYVAPGTRPNDSGMGYVAPDPNRLPYGFAVIPGCVGLYSWLCCATWGLDVCVCVFCIVQILMSMFLGHALHIHIVGLICDLDIFVCSAICLLFLVCPAVLAMRNTFRPCSFAMSYGASLLRFCTELDV